LRHDFGINKTFVSLYKTLKGWKRNVWLSHHWLLAGLLAWFGLSLPFGILIGRLIRTADEPPEPQRAKHSEVNNEDADIFPRKTARF
jgi:hypothetical protein